MMIAAAHVRIGKGWEPVGWYVIRPTESIAVDALDPSEKEFVMFEGIPVTRLDDRTRRAQPGDDEFEAAEIRRPADDVAPETSPPLERLSGRRIFDTAHDMPKIVGGLGAYYIHIEYPEEALQAGVEGRLLLSFIVETDGRTSGVEVIHALHPACDSAAVRALRRTRFVPGRQEGEIVPVRMRLPVRFRIVPRGDGLAAANDA